MNVIEFKPKSLDKKLVNKAIDEMILILEQCFEIAISLEYILENIDCDWHGPVYANEIKHLLYEAKKKADKLGYIKYD